MLELFHNTGQAHNTHIYTQFVSRSSTSSPLLNLYKLIRESETLITRYILLNFTPITLDITVKGNDVLVSNNSTTESKLGYTIHF